MYRLSVRNAKSLTQYQRFKLILPSRRRPLVHEGACFSYLHSSIIHLVLRPSLLSRISIGLGLSKPSVCKDSNWSSELQVGGTETSRDGESVNLPALTDEEI